MALVAIRGLCSVSSESSDLPSALTSNPAVKIHMYADDIKIHDAYNDNNQTYVRPTFSQSINAIMD